MGFLNKAKKLAQKAIPKNFGDETLETYTSDGEEFLVEEEPKKKVSLAKGTVETTFAVQDDADFDEFFAVKPESPRSKPANIQDVLEVLGIPETYSIDVNRYYEPESLMDVGFDIQVPKGYDMGQVEAFYDKAKTTIEKYWELLRERNDHIVKLATTVDRLEVDLKNLRLQNEIAEGINIMPTSGYEELETKYYALQTKCKKLENQLDKMSGKDSLSSEEREKYDQLKNAFSVVSREKEVLQEENQDLRESIADRDEIIAEYEEREITYQSALNSYKNVNDASLPLLEEEDLPFISKTGSNRMFEKRVEKNSDFDLPDELPDIDLPDDGDILLPDLDLLEDETYNSPPPRKNNVFALDPEPLSFDIPEDDDEELDWNR